MSTQPPPSIQVIIRTLGRPTLGRALRSVATQTVLAQGHASVTAFVVDAAASGKQLPLDGGDQAGFMSRLRVEVVRSDKPLHRAAAAQAGLEAALKAHPDGWALFLDDDDELLPEHLDKLMRALQAQPQAVAAYTGVVQVRPAGPGLSDEPEEVSRFERCFEPWQLLASNHLPIHAVLFNAARVAAAGVRFDPRFDVFEDWDFWLQVQRIGPLVPVPGVSARYWLQAKAAEPAASTPSAAAAQAAESWASGQAQSQAQQAQHGDADYWRVWAKWWIEAPADWWAELLAQARRAPDRHRQDVEALELMQQRVEQSLVYQQGLEALRDALQADVNQLRHEAEVTRQAQQQTAQALAQSEEALAQSEEALAQSEEALAQSEEALAQSEEALAQSWQASEHLRLELDQARRLVRQRDQAIAQMQQTLALAQQHVRLLLESNSWRLTAPLRWVSKAWRMVTQLHKSDYRADLWWRLHHRSYRRPALLASVWPDPYTAWCAAHDGNGPAEREDALHHIRRLKGLALGAAERPLLSVLMPTYNPPLAFLDEAIASLQAQWYPDWELCIADDASKAPGVLEHLRQWRQREPRIRLVERAQNGHISAASNSALQAARGQWVVLMDQDDLLPPQALWRVVQALQQHPRAGVLYSDEDKVDEQGRRFGPYFKAAFDLDLFRGQNMVSHLGVYRRDLVESVGGFRVGYEGSQDHDLALRCVERLQPDEVVHIPRVLYHWRVHAQSTASGHDAKPYALNAGLRAVQDHLRRTGVQATAHAHPEIPHQVVLHQWPEGFSASITTQPSAGAPPYRLLCWGVPAAGEPPLSAALRDAMPPSQSWDQDETWLNACVRLKSWAAATAGDSTEWVLLLHVSAQAVQWSGDLQAWAAHAAEPGVGAVGPARRDAQGRLLDAGWLRTRDGHWVPMARGLGRETHGYYGQLSLAHGVSGLAPAAVALRLAAIDADAPGLRLKPGWRLVWTPQAQGAGAWLDAGLHQLAPAAPEPALVSSAWAGHVAVSGAPAPSEDPPTDPSYSPHLCELHADHRLTASGGRSTCVARTR